MATLSIVVGGTPLPKVLVPIGRTRVFVGAAKRMANRQLRRAGGEKVSLAYSGEPLTESERTTWANAHPLGSSITVVDELGVSRTMFVTAYSETLVSAAPTTDYAATGPTFYRVDVEVEER